MNPQTIQAAVDQHNAGHLAEAERMYRAILAIEPANAEVINYLAILMASTNRLQDAAAMFATLTRLQPTDAKALTNLGFTLHQLGRFNEALAAQQAALRLEPDFATAHNNLGTVLRDMNRPEEALAAAERAIELQPNYPQAMNTAANALSDLSRMDEARDWSARALAIDPNNAMARMNYGMALLATGDWLNGWREYEWRPRVGLPSLPQQPVPPPRWDGSPLNGRNLLVMAEQGFGDAILMVRFAEALANAPFNAKVIWTCPPPMVPLLKTARGVSAVYANLAELPPIDTQIPMMSLPGMLRTTVETIPANVPYLGIDPVRAEAWRAKLGAADPAGRFRIGITWASAAHAFDARLRSMTLADVGPLAIDPGITFVSLQKEDAQSQALRPPAQMRLIDLTSQLNDFADTAALIGELDMVITVDTAVCNLAGALAKTTWTMLPIGADWRWLLNRDDTRWYPTMRLFRQRTRADWAGVVTDVAAALDVQLGDLPWRGRA